MLASSIDSVQFLDLVILQLSKPTLANRRLYGVLHVDDAVLLEAASMLADSNQG
jgi:hypothetical protein